MACTNFPHISAFLHYWTILVIWKFPGLFHCGVGGVFPNDYIGRCVCVTTAINQNYFYFYSFRPHIFSRMDNGDAGKDWLFLCNYWAASFVAIHCITERVGEVHWCLRVLFFLNLLGHIPKGLSLYGWIDGAWKSAIKAAKISFETQQFYIATYHIWNWRKMKQLRE